MEGRHKPHGAIINTESMVFDEEQMEILFIEIGKRIQEERVRRNVSQKMLAIRSNLSDNAIYKMEHFQQFNCYVGLKTLLKVSYGLGVDVATFLPRENRGMSNGDKFEEITRCASVSTINYLLEQARGFVRLQK